DGRARLFPLQQPANLGDNPLIKPSGAENVVEVRWRTDPSLLSKSRVVTIAKVLWPAAACTPTTDPTTSPCFQVHVARAPVEIEPQSAPLYLFFKTYLPFVAPSNAVVDNFFPDDPVNGQSQRKLFKATIPGWSVVAYKKDTLQSGPVAFEVVKTVADMTTGAFCEIGKKITDGDHNEVGRAGYVLDRLAFYDAVGPNAAYNRNDRLGIILPVNRFSTSRPQDVQLAHPELQKEMQVAWYKGNFRGVYWASKAVEYDCHWPFNPDK